MKRSKQKQRGKKKSSRTIGEVKNNRADNGVGMPEDIRVVHGEQNNPHDG